MYMEPMPTTYTANSRKRNRKYSNEYLKLGFIPSPTNETRPMCLLCERTFSNEAMKPSKMKDHFIRVHHDRLDEELDFYVELKEKFYNRSKPLLMLFNHNVPSSDVNKFKVEQNQQDTTECASSGVEDKQQWMDSAAQSPIGDAEGANPYLPYKRLKLEHRISSVKNAVNNITNQPEENEFDIYGFYVSTCLRKLPLPRAFRLQEKMNSLIVEERISYYSTQSSSTSSEMNAKNHMSDNDQLVEGSSHVTNEDVLEISDVKTEAVEIECEPEFTL